MPILCNNLYNSILIEPFLTSDVNTLNIVSGYATSAMAFHHLNFLAENQSKLKINLTVGMVPKDGMSISNHRGFLELVNNDYKNKFFCSYVMCRPQIHSKLYIWCKDTTPLFAFIGSANYTQTALILSTQKEVMASCDAVSAYDYFLEIQKDTIYCEHPDTENEIILVNDYYQRTQQTTANGTVINDDAGQSSYQYLPQASVSLVERRTRDVHKKAGLNWGQRDGREPNQAYLQLSSDVYESDFFPMKSIHFTVLTDDNRSFICTRAQKDHRGHAIETPHNNSLLGEYFRNRLGLANGAPVKTADLDRYGRRDVVFSKIDDETYYMDFSV